MFRGDQPPRSATVLGVRPAQDTRAVETKPVCDHSDAAAACDDGGCGFSHAMTMRLSHSSVNAIFASIMRTSQWPDSPSVTTLRRMNGEELKRLLEMPGRSQAALARWLGFPDNSYVNKMVKGQRQIKLDELPKIQAYLKATSRGEEVDPSIAELPDLPSVSNTLAYVRVEVLPTFAGMGGGGTGDGDAETALISRRLVEDELNARPSDLLLINVRGDSMFDPSTGRGFVHGDQLLIDRRDTNPRQPGPFALWYDDGYVVKNVEIVRKTGKLRIFSNNPIYSDDEADPEEVRIMGRPVWFARRL